MIIKSWFQTFEPNHSSIIYEKFPIYDLQILQSISNSLDRLNQKNKQAGPELLQNLDQKHIIWC